MRSDGDFILNEFVSVLSGKFKLNSFSNLISVVGFKMDSETPRGFDLPKVPFALYSDGVTRKREGGCFYLRTDTTRTLARTRE